MEILTKKEAAQQLRISTRTIDRYRAVGLIRGIKVRQKVLFVKSQLESLLSKHVERVV
jgi:excisionase family DNA binding protein